MPVGVPKVPFLIPGDEEATWVDLYNRLYRERLLFICDELEDELSHTVVGLMVFLCIEDSTREQYLFINSPGGNMMYGLTVYDLMQTLPPDFNTICMGLAASMGSVVLIGGEITKRIAFPHARVMIHQPVAKFSKKTRAGRLLLEVSRVRYLYEIIVTIYAQKTGKDPKVIEKHLQRDFYMSATEAQAYGIVDLVGIEE